MVGGKNNSCEARLHDSRLLCAGACKGPSSDFWDGKSLESEKTHDRTHHTSICRIPAVLTHKRWSGSADRLLRHVRLKLEPQAGTPDGWKGKIDLSFFFAVAILPPK